MFHILIKVFKRPRPTENHLGVVMREVALCSRVRFRFGADFRFSIYTNSCFSLQRTLGLPTADDSRLKKSFTSRFQVVIFCYWAKLLNYWLLYNISNISIDRYQEYMIPTGTKGFACSSKHKPIHPLQQQFLYKYKYPSRLRGNYYYKTVYRTLCRNRQFIYIFS